MGLLDKAKAKGTELAQKGQELAKDAAQKGQAKLDEVQGKKGADALLRDLGAAVYATKSGRATPSTEADIARLVAALETHESEHGAVTLAPESAAAAPTAAPSPPPAAADPSSPPPPPPTAQTL